MFRSVHFGISFQGLETVGYTLINPDGTTAIARTESGVIELGGGAYGADIAVPADFEGGILWDTAEDSNKKAFEDWYTLVIDEQGGTNLIDVRGTGADEVTLRIVSPTGVPVPNAMVWLTSDELGSSVVAGTLYTNSQGEVLFMLTDGVQYYLWVVKDGIQAIRGRLFTAAKDTVSEVGLNEFQVLPATSGTSISLADRLTSPKRIRTDEGTVEERDVDEIIKADRYVNSDPDPAVPWGIKIAKRYPGGTL